MIIRLAEIRALEFRGFDIVFPRGSILAATEEMRGVLFAFEPGQEHPTDAEPTDHAMEAFYTFHGRDAVAVSAVEIPGRWQLVGEVDSILYLSRKLHGGGDGTPNLFRHTFNSGTLVHRSAENPAWLRITGEELYVDDRGIVN